MSRPQLVLACGLMCDARVYAPQRDALKSDFEILVVDFFGLDSIGAMADKVLAVAGPKFSLAGHSMGGRVALEAYARAPHRIERLALLDTAYHPRTNAEAEGRLKLVTLGFTQGMKAVADAWLPPMLAPAHRGDPALVSSLTDMICGATPEIFERQQHALLNRPDHGPLLSRIACPTLCATGRFDDWSPVSIHEDMAKQIPDAHLTVFEKAGHMSTLETPDDMTKALAGLMRR